MSDFISQVADLFAAHAWAGLGGLLCMLFVTLLTDRAKFMPTWNSPWRPFLGTLLGAVGLVLNQLQSGHETVGAIINVFATALPTLIAELLVLTKAGGGGAGKQSDTPDPSKPFPPPAKPPTIAAMSSMQVFQMVAEREMTPEAGAEALVKARAWSLREYARPIGHALLAAFCLVAVGALPGCAFGQAVVKDLPTVIADVQEVQTWLEALHAASIIFFAAEPNAKAQADVAKGYAGIETALAAVNNAAIATDDAAKGRLADATAKAQEACIDFEHLMRQLGVIVPDGTVGAPRGGVERVQVPHTPRLMLRKTS